jgi:hypothetical protein
MIPLNERSLSGCPKNSGFLNDSGNHSSGSFVFPEKINSGLSGKIFGNNFGFDEGQSSSQSETVVGTLQVVTGLNSSRTKPSDDCWSALSSHLRQIDRRLSLSIKTDEIINIKRFHYDGLLYDFKSTTGILLCQGIYISNCGCSVENVIPGMEEAHEFDDEDLKGEEL